MNFGMVSYDGLKKEDFLLSIQKQDCLSGKRVASPKIYIGLSQWNCKRWAGSLYPEKYKEADTLKYYAEKFNSIELNATHYHVPDEEQIKKWVNKINNGFKFCPKYSKIISHRGKIIPETKGKNTEFFLNAIKSFGENLGPCFLQVNESYTANWAKDDLLRYLKVLPEYPHTFIEVRNESWFKDNVKDLFAKQLEEIGIGWVITDTPGIRNTNHLILTIPKAFVRFVCQGNNELDKFRITEWRKVLQNWIENGLEECYFFLHVHNDNDAIDFAAYVQTEFANV